MKWSLVHTKIPYLGQERNFDDHNDLDNNLDSIKLKIPTFQEKNDSKTYLDWEKNVEFVSWLPSMFKGKDKTNYSWIYWLCYYLT